MSKPRKTLSEPEITVLNPTNETKETLQPQKVKAVLIRPELREALIIYLNSKPRGETNNLAYELETSQVQEFTVTQN